MVLGRPAGDRLGRRGRGIGKGLMKVAVLRILQVASEIGVRALQVDVISDEARKFHLHYGFHESPMHSMTLMLPLKQARNVVPRCGLPRPWWTRLVYDLSIGGSPDEQPEIYAGIQGRGGTPGSGVGLRGQI